MIAHKFVGSALRVSFSQIEHKSHLVFGIIKLLQNIIGNITISSQRFPTI